MVGKWHLCPTDEMNLASTRRNWPSGRGFERWYGFLGAETNQWFPDLVYDNHFVDQPRTPGGGLPPDRRPHRQGTRVHQGRQGRSPRTSPSSSTTPPAPATHRTTRRRSGSRSSRAASTRATRPSGRRPWPDRRSWGSSRRTPSCPRSTRSARPRPAQGPDGQPFPLLDYTRPWDSLNDDEKALFARMAEVYAGFLGHADHNIGRLLDYLEENDAARQHPRRRGVGQRGQRRGRARTGRSTR